ncbi:glycosyltransferase family 4 protein [Gordonia amicalis]|nr:glycosyltransferase family 4 protein [Gordonia amicalis]
MGHKVTVLTTFPHYPNWRVYPGYKGVRKYETWQGVRVARLRTYIPRSPGLMNRIAMEAIFAVQVFFRRELSQADVVVATSPALIASGTALGRVRFGLRRRHRKFVTWVQDLYTLGIQETSQSEMGSLIRVLKSFEAFILRNSDYAAVIHPSFEQYLNDSLAVPSAKVRVIRNWSHLDSSVKDEEIERFRSSVGWSREQRVVLHAGNMGRKQGLENVVRAAQIAHAEQDDSLVFVLMGDGSERASLEAMAKGCPNLKFVDPVSASQFPVALAASDLLLVNEASAVQGMAVPSKLTSYFYAGRPVVAATNSGTPTANEVGASGAGECVRPGDPEGLLELIRSLIERPNHRVEMGARGIEYYRMFLTPDSAFAAFDRLLRQSSHNCPKLEFAE